MKTQQLYYQDAYLKSARAIVLSISSKGDKTDVVLDKTLFYPGGGGQPADMGKIGGLELEKVFKVDGEIVHRVLGKLEVNQEVELQLDFDRRLRFMRIHSAGHLIHDVLMSLVDGLIPIKGDHGNSAFLQYDGELKNLTMDQLQQEINTVLLNDLPILTKDVTYEELEKEVGIIQQGVPKDKRLRMLKIGEFDAMADGGVQVRSTNEIGSIFILNINISNGKTTILYKLGDTNDSKDYIDHENKKVKFLISKEFNQKFPHVNCAVLEVGGVTVDDGIVLRSDDYTHREDYLDNQLVKSFQKFYGDLKLGNKAGYPAVENLYRRLLSDGYVPKVNNIVDGCNLISVQTLIPCGVFDADQIKGDMILRFSREGEEYKPIGGGVELLPGGIAVIADEEKILNLFPYRDSIHPKITKNTKKVMVLADIVEGVGEDEAVDAATRIGELLEKISGGKAGKVVLGSVASNEMMVESESDSNGQKRIFSGIRATGRLHVGNYLGAIKGMLKLQDDGKYQMLFSVVDVHAMTTPYDKETLAQKTYDVVLDYLACGLDPEKSILLVQSKVADLHAELMFYFSTVVTMARMQHLPTFKEKVKQHPDSVTMALLNYPVLMAADILAYKSELVPVGVDQEPHLEITREIARKMNDQYGMDFPEPKRFATKGEYVPSLLGEGKMSKSVEGSYINLTDDLETIKKKLAGAPTDSGRGEKVPAEGGVANLLQFVELFQGEEKRKEYESIYTSEGIRYGDLKKELSEAIYKELKPIQEKRKELEANPTYVQKIIDEGAQKAREVAYRTVLEVKERMGLK